VKSVIADRFSKAVRVLEVLLACENRANMADAKRKAQAGNEWEGMNFREGRDFEGPNIIQCTFDIDYDSEMNIL